VRTFASVITRPGAFVKSAKDALNSAAAFPTSTPPNDPTVMMRHSLFALPTALSLLATSAAAQRPAVERKIDSLLVAMTLEEKLGQLNLLSVDGDTVTREQAELIRKGLVGGLLNLTGAEATRRVQRLAVEQSRLKIPLIFGYDVIHGYRTTFPIPLAEAGTWDPDLVEAAARVAAREAAAAGVHWTYAPMVDIARDPRWGRIAEGSGEDPYLGSVMAVARVRGFQGADLRSPEAVLATVKHYAASGGAEGGRDYGTVDVSERTLREVYLPPFKAAVDAGVGSIMTSFNEIAGVPSTAGRWLLATVLRREWGFPGFVVSDWTSVAELQAHGLAGSRADAGRLALEAGVDMDMQSRIYLEDLPALVHDGRVAVATVDAAVRRILSAKALLGLFEDPYRRSSVERERATLLAPAHRQLARRIAREAIVLLKNDRNVLPLNPAGKTLAVLGPLADARRESLGPWQARGRGEDVVTPLDGIKRRVSPGTTVLYAKGGDIAGTDTSGVADAVRLARRADVAVLVLGEAAEMSGEAASRSVLGLPGAQQRLLEAVHATGTPVVLVLMNGRPLTLEWAADHVPAILETWFLGVETGHALADVLFGDVAPSGKLPVTVPRSVGQVPIYYNHKNTGRPPTAQEKYTSKYLDVPWTPLYAFGYGLSYTTFGYGDLRLSAASITPAEPLKVSVTVRNTGTREGAEVVQLYLRDEVGSVTRPVRELKGFRRVSLRPGEARTIEFSVTPEQLAFYGPDLRPVVEPGTFRVFVGGSSVGGLEAAFEVR
jgi:beta-glucosidase